MFLVSQAPHATCDLRKVLLAAVPCYRSSPFLSGLSREWGYTYTYIHIAIMELPKTIKGPDSILLV